MRVFFCLLALMTSSFFVSCVTQETVPQNVPVFPAGAESARLSLLHFDSLGNRIHERNLIKHSIFGPNHRIDSISEKVGEDADEFGPVHLLKPGLARVKISGRYGASPVIYAKLNFVAYPGSLYEIEVRPSSGFPRVLVIDRRRNKIVARASIR